MTCQGCGKDAKECAYQAYCITCVVIRMMLDGLNGRSKAS